MFVYMYVATDNIYAVMYNSVRFQYADQPLALYMYELAQASGEQFSKTRTMCYFITSYAGLLGKILTCLQSCFHNNFTALYCTQQT